MRFAAARGVVLTKVVWERTQKTSHCPLLQTRVKVKREKCVGMPFPRVPAPLQPWLQLHVTIEC